MNPSIEATKSESPADVRGSVVKDIHAKWDKFTEQEVSGMKTRDELVTQVTAKYGLEKMQAQRDVDALLKGRQL